MAAGSPEGLALPEGCCATLVENSPDLCAICDDAGTARYANRALCAIAGYDPLEVIGRSVFDFIDAADREAVLGALREAGSRPGTPISVHFRVRHKQGFLRPLEAVLTGTARPDVIVAQCRDIAFRKILEEQLVRERQVTSALLEQVGWLVIVMDPALRIVRFNRACERATGFAALEVAGRNASDFLAGEGFPPDILHTHRPLEFESEWMLKDGTARRIYWSASVIRTPGGQPEYVIATGTDMVEQRGTAHAVAASRRDIENSREELRGLAARLLTTSEEERRRVSRELHDDLNQRLAMLAMELESLSREPAAPPERLRELHQRVLELSVEIRRMARQLHPTILDELGIVAALRAYCSDFARREAIRVRFLHRHVPELMSPDAGLCLYRVAQECLRNLARHACRSPIMAAASIPLPPSARAAWVLSAWRRGSGWCGAASRSGRVRAGGLWSAPWSRLGTPYEPRAFDDRRRPPVRARRPA